MVGLHYFLCFRCLIFPAVSRYRRALTWLAFMICVQRDRSAGDWRAVARAGGLSELAGRVHPRFAQILLLVYLSIGPCLAIRTASTSFQMLAPLHWRCTWQLIYSIVFFAAAFFVALHPEKLTSWLGRIVSGTGNLSA